MSFESLNPQMRATGSDRQTRSSSTSLDRLQRLRVLILLRVRQQLLQVVEVGPGRAVGRDPIEQQRAVVAADETRRSAAAAGSRCRLQLDPAEWCGGQLRRAQRLRRSRRSRPERGVQRQRERQRARQSNVPRRIVAATVK